MRKFLTIGIGFLFLISSVSAYSATRDLAREGVKSEIDRQITAHPEFKQVGWIIGKLRNDRTGALYRNVENTATLDGQVSIFAIRSIMTHDFSHYIWFYQLDDVQRASYCRLYDYFQDTVSDFGLENCLENFAEGYAVIHYDSRWTGDRGSNWRGTFKDARSYFLKTRQGEFINNLR